MSHQQRTWTQTHDPLTGLDRWDVFINGKQVPGGFILKVDSDCFEIHYPHLVPFTKSTLEEAKDRVEWAPPITVGVQYIARPADGDIDGFMTPEKAGEALGVSVYRINAMVANGRLAARRTPDGSIEVAVSSLHT